MCAALRQRQSVSDQQSATVIRRSSVCLVVKKPPHVEDIRGFSSSLGSAPSTSVTSLIENDRRFGG